MGKIEQKTAADGSNGLLVAELERIAGRPGAINPEEIRRSFKPVSLGRGEYFVREGEIPQKLGFIHRGLMKYFYLDTGGNEWIKHFSAEQNFVASYASFIYQAPSPYYITALEDTELLTISYADYSGKLAASSLWCTVARKYTESIYHQKERREAGFLKFDATRRYLNFLQEYPHLTDRVSLQDIASFLGITAVSLSRIRRKINRKINKC